MKIDPQILKNFQYKRSYKVEEVETEFKIQLLNPAKFKSYKNLYIQLYDEDTLNARLLVGQRDIINFRV